VEISKFSFDTDKVVVLLVHLVELGIQLPKHLQKKAQK
jgi:hypothetical protein